MTMVTSGSPGGVDAAAVAVADSNSPESVGVAASTGGGEEYPLAMKVNSKDVCGMWRVDRVRGLVAVPGRDSVTLLFPCHWIAHGASDLR